MKKFTFCFIIAIISIFICLSFSDSPGCRTSVNTVHIFGKVTDSTGAGIPTAEVMFYSETDTTSAFSDENGLYSLDLEIFIEEVDDYSADSPYSFKLYQNYPNPFNPSTTIEYELPEQTNVRLEIYNITGQATCHLKNCVEGPGRFRAQWNGCDDSGRNVGAGIYIYRLKTDNFVETKKMLLLDGGVGTRAVGHSNKMVIQRAGKNTVVEECSYEIQVEKEGYKTYQETDFTVSEAVKEIEKNIVLQKLEPPVADAGDDQVSKVGSYEVLDGSRSTPGDGERIILYKWYQSEENPAQVHLLALEKLTISFQKEGIYTFTLIVDNDIQDSETDEVVVTVDQRDNFVFEDTNLEAHIRYNLKKQIEELSYSDLLSVDSLHFVHVVTDNVTSLSGIEHCKNLEYLLMGHQSIYDLSPLADLTKLTKLNLTQNRIIVDVSPLAGLINLTYLNLDSNKITDISMLGNLTQLTYLNVMLNPITGISVVANMNNLKDLLLGNSSIGDISHVAELKQLSSLWLAKCEITDITPVANLTNLKLLYLNYNSITDILSLSGLVQLERLYLDDNQIVDISPLENMTGLDYLRLNRNKISDILSLVKNSGLDKGDFISLTNNPLSDISINEYIPALKNRGVYVIY